MDVDRRNIKAVNDKIKALTNTIEEKISNAKEDKGLEASLNTLLDQTREIQGVFAPVYGGTKRFENFEVHINKQTRNQAKIEQRFGDQDPNTAPLSEALLALIPIISYD